MLKKFFISLSILVSLSFTSCGGESSKEARELLSKILQFVGIPHNIIVNVCQDSNRDGICGAGELFTKVTLNKGDSVDDIWKKITLTADGRYFLETYDETLPILLSIQDGSNVAYDGGAFTLTFDGFENREQNETKELSILQSMVDAKHLTLQEVEAIKTLTNQESQDKFYSTLLTDLETNINTLRAKGLDSKTTMSANIKEMAEELKDKNITKTLPDKINACGSDQACVDEEIKELSVELIITPEERDAIAKENNSDSEVSTPIEVTPIPTESTAETSTSKLKKTGQTTSYEQFDDGEYQIGVTPSYSRSGEIVTDNITKLQWQDDEEVGQVRKTWEDAKSYCSALLVGGQSDWRLPTPKELMMIVDNGKFNPALNSTFVNVASNNYWSSTSDASDSSSAWFVSFGNGVVYWNSKTDERSVRCVRGGQL